MKTFWALALFVALAFAGCADDSPDSVPEEEQTPPPTDESLTPEPVVNNTRPVIDLQTDVNAGLAPLNVTFTLEISDADGDDVLWEMDFGDGSDPASGIGSGTYGHVYEAGNFTAILAAHDGTDSVETTITIQVMAPDVGEEGPIWEDLWAVQYADLMCHAKEFTDTMTGFYIHDRPGEGEPYGTGYYTGGGTWIYEETNDVEGLQLGGEGPTGADGAYAHCENPDLVIF